MAEKGTVLIIGGGISGVTLALELAQLKIPSTLIERNPSLGGLSASFCCKASETCNKCFAYAVDKKGAEIRRCPEVSIRPQTELISVTGGPPSDRPLKVQETLKQRQSRFALNRSRN